MLETWTLNQQLSVSGTSGESGNSGNCGLVIPVIAVIQVFPGISPDFPDWQNARNSTAITPDFDPETHQKTAITGIAGTARIPFSAPQNSDTPKRT